MLTIELQPQALIAEMRPYGVIGSFWDDMIELKTNFLCFLEKIHLQPGKVLLVNLNGSLQYPESELFFTLISTE